MESSTVEPIGRGIDRFMDELPTRFVTAYGPHLRVTARVSDEGGAKQSMKDEVDINKIVDRFAETGLVTHLAKGQPRYLDVSEVGDYREALEQVRSVGEFFNGLPSKIRSRFGNDPAEFLDFMSDPANADEIRELGLEDQVEEGPPAPESPAPAPEAPEGASGAE